MSLSTLPPITITTCGFPPTVAVSFATASAPTPLTHSNALKLPVSLTSDTLWDIESADNNGQQLWIGSRNWLNLFDTTTQTTRRFNPDTTPALDTNNNVWSLYKDRNQRLWIASLGGGIYRFNPQSGDLTQYDKSRGLSNNLVRTITEDNDGNLWVGTDNGLNVLDANTGQIDHYFHHSDNPYTLSSNEINKVYKDRKGRIWVGTYGGGLNRFDAAKRRFARFTFASLGLNDARTPKIINDLFEDRQGILWIATDQGIVKLLPPGLNSRRYGLSETAQSDLTAIINQGDSAWAALNNQWIHFDLATLAIDHSIPLPGQVLTATQVEHNRFLLALANQDVFELTVNANGDEHQLTPLNAGNNISAVLAESSKRYWLGLYRNEGDGGLALYEPGKGITQTWFGSDSILDIERYGEHTLLLATNNQGVIRFDLQSFEHNRITNQQNQALNHLTDLHVGHNNRIWLGTTGSGLAELLLDKQEIRSLAPGLGAIDWVLQTTDKTLWLAANNELAKFQIDTNGTQSFGASYGLNINKFHKKSAILSGDTIWFGAQQGLIRFNPGATPAPPNPAPVSLTELRIFNQPETLAQTLNHSQLLTLSWDDYLFSISFAAPDYQHGDRQTFQYQLQGFDDRWITTNGTNPIATYSSVPPGKYWFLVKTGNSPVRVLPVTITPPWWRTPLAHTSYVLVALLAIVLLIHLRTRALSKRAAELEQGIALRTTELEHKSATIEMLLQQKQRLFSNISHELRTPLTLLLGPAEQLLKQLPQAPYQSAIAMIRRNALRMHHMVEQLLQLASLEADKAKPFKIIALDCALQQMAEAAAPLAKRKAQTLVVKPIPKAYLRMQEDAFEQIVGNLLSNAFKYTDHHGHIEIDSAVSQTMAIIKIRDNGLGIAEQFQPLIFDRFERGDFANDSQQPGSGIGLALVKEWVDAHQGKITVQSEQYKGSTFTVELPLYLDTVDKINDTVTATTWLVEPETPQQDALPEPIMAQDDRPILLIVEDNADMRAHLLNLVQDDYRCLGADNGQSGLAHAREHVPDIIVCDVMMPLMDGFEFTAQVKQDPVLSHIPVILLTALADQQNRLAGLQTKADDYLSKPFNDQELKIRLQNLLSVRAILRERFAHEHRNDPMALSRSKTELNEKDQQFVDRFEHILDKHFEDPDFQLPHAAEAMAMSDRQLQRKLKAIMDLNFSQLLRRTRLRHATELLSQGQAINLVGEAVGFSSPAYFSTCFKAQFGFTPKSFQQQHIEQNREAHSG